MIELYECGEPGCDTLVDVSYKNVLTARNVFCRWHARRTPEPGPAPNEPIRKDVVHVTGRIGPCFYCGYEEPLTREHVIPKSEGRQFKRAWNTVWACEFCNRKKADMQLAEWLKALAGYVEQHGHNGVHVKYRRVLERSGDFVSHLLDDPSHMELRRYRGRIDPEFR